MPIRFRCDYCNKLLGIARRKAGSETTCPHCGYTITVPDLNDDVPDDDLVARTELDDIDAILNPAAARTHEPATVPIPPPPPPSPARPAEPARAERPRPAPVPPPRQVPMSAPTRPVSTAPTPKVAAPLPPGERPLFERDVDSVLGVSNKSPDRPEPAKPAQRPTSGMDAGSLGTSDGGQLVLSSQKATVLAVAVVMLLALSFAAGFLLASR